MITYFPTIFPVTNHTDHVGFGSIFVAHKGLSKSGLDYIAYAVEKGAREIVVDRSERISEQIISLLHKKKVVIHYVEDARKALAELSAQAAGFPASKLKIIGITGTKGKTTTSFLLAHILQKAGYKVALLSTVHNRILDTIYPSSLTTPQADYLHQFFALCVKQDVEYVVMEVAAQALSMDRVHGIVFDAVIFTNFSHEHLEFYSSMDDYFNAKIKLFTQVKVGGHCLINGDDTWLQTISSQEKYVHFGKRFHNNIVFALQNPGKFLIVFNHKETVFCRSDQLLGEYNGYNSTAAVGMAYYLGVPLSLCVSALETFEGVPGRFEQYRLSNGARAIIDYAHNPSSFEAVLSTVAQLTNHMIVIFGAGGGRDVYKRPEMGRIASDYASLIILTSDNPRHENPQVIVEQIQCGIPSKKRDAVVIELDRAQAIRYAYYACQPGSYILLLGKGPDEYQMIGDTKYYFSERELLQDFLRSTLV